MRRLLFFARVAFICNVFFIACLVFRYSDIVSDQNIKGFTIVVGWLLAPILNFIFCIVFLFMSYFKRTSFINIPKWIIAFNVIVLIAQLVIIPFV